MFHENLKRNTIDNMFVSASSVVRDSNYQGDTGESRVPGSTNGNAVGCFRYFKLFPYLNDDMRLLILSFVADAPFEKLPENYPISSLTHYLPRVNKNFREIANSDLLWKPAIERMAQKEPHVWRKALNQLCQKSNTISGKTELIEDLQNNHNSTAVIIMDTESESGISSTVRQNYLTEPLSQLIGRTHHALQMPSYKFIYSQVVNKYLRVKAPVYSHEGHVTLGEPYMISFTEPRYRLMINDIMKNHSVDERRNGALVRKEAVFVHANRMPLESTQPAVVVQILNCTTHVSGTVDVHVKPVTHVWLEKLTIRPNTFGLVEAQCLKMGQRLTNEMNHLARQEAMAQVMDNMTREFENAMNTTSDNFASLPNTSSDNDDASYLSNQYQVTDVEDESSASSSSSNEDDDLDTNSSSLFETDDDFDSDDDDDDYQSDFST